LEGKDDSLDTCLGKLSLAPPAVDPISPASKALLSFTQGLLRRRFHD
jgi:hypothetical protein